MRGGKRIGAGRPTKADELKLIEKLDAIIESNEVIEILKKEINKGNMRAIKLYFEYRFSKPKQDIELLNSNEVPLFKIEL